MSDGEATEITTLTSLPIEVLKRIMDHVMKAYDDAARLMQAAFRRMLVYERIDNMRFSRTLADGSQVFRSSVLHSSAFRRFQNYYVKRRDYQTATRVRERERQQRRIQERRWGSSSSYI